MARMFQGNLNMHYVADFKNGRIEPSGKRVPKYEHVSGPPTVEEFQRHLDGIQGILVVPVTTTGACRFGFIDVDEYPVDLKALSAKVKRWGLDGRRREHETQAD